MNVRSITVFLDPGWPPDDAALRRAGDFIAAARPAFEAAGLTVQTARLATVPYPRLWPDGDANAMVAGAQELEAAARAHGFDYLSLGPALPDRPDSYAVIPQILAATEAVFLAGVLATRREGISMAAVRACARVIHRAATLEPNGFGNLYFAALANVPPGAPFFPAAYHSGGPSRFALAIEAADLAVAACRGAGDLPSARRDLVNRLETQGHRLARLARALDERQEVAFTGIDFSLAPFPEEARSLGTAMEALGAPRLGDFGSLAAAAILAEAVDRADFPRTGFSGLMLPVLEDAVLAARAAEGALSVADLLMYSAVCGTGLDTVPLPGDVSPGQLEPVLLDLAALALRLDKPLTARLMPIPGKAAGDPTAFDFPYFANSRVLSLPAGNVGGLLEQTESFRIGALGALD